MAQKCRHEETRESVNFPSKLKNQTDSLLFVKQLTGVAISNICFLRCVFGFEYYKCLYIDEAPVEILAVPEGLPSDAEQPKKAAQLLEYINGALQAVDDGYLERLVLAFCRDKSDPDTVLETYTLSFKYFKDGTPQFRLECKGSKDLKYENDVKCSRKAVLCVMQNVYKLTKNFSDLPDDVLITMKLYYNEGTPADYEPPGFKPSTEGFVFEAMDKGEKPMGYKCGEVDSNFHIMSFHARSVLLKNPSADCQEVPDDLDVEMAVDESAVGVNDQYLDTSGQGSCDSRYWTASKSVRSKPLVPKFGKSGMNVKPRKQSDNQKVPDLNFQSDPIAEPEPEHRENAIPCDQDMSCICSVNKVAEGELMLKCGKCFKWQHGVCYGYPDVCKQPTAQYCIECCQKDRSLQVADPKLQGLLLGGRPAFKVIALLRQSLWALRNCASWKTISEATFKQSLHIFEGSSGPLFKRLCKENMLSGRVSKVFNREIWEKQCRSLLHLPVEFDNEDGSEVLTKATAKLRVHSPLRKMECSPKKALSTKTSICAARGKRKIYDDAQHSGKRAKNFTNSRSMVDSPP